MSNDITQAEHRRLSKKLMKEYIIRADDTPKSVVVHAIPIVTSKGRPILELHTGSYLDIDQATLLRNWLSDYIGHHKEMS